MISFRFIVSAECPSKEDVQEGGLVAANMAATLVALPHLHSTSVWTCGAYYIPSAKALNCEGQARKEQAAIIAGSVTRVLVTIVASR